MAVNQSTLSSTGAEGTISGAGDRYVSISTWESAAQGNHGAGDQTILECYAFVENGVQLVISGWTTSLGNGITIKAAAGEEHGGVVGAGYIINGYDGPQPHAVNVVVDYVTIQDITIYQGITSFSNGSAVRIEAGDVGTFCKLHRLILSAGSQSEDTAIQVRNNNAEVFNCLALPGGTRGITTYSNAANTNLSSNTVFATEFGIRIFSTAQTGIVVANNVCFGATTDYGGFIDEVTNINNASGDLTAIGTAPVTGVVEADFVDFQANGSGDYSPAPGGAIATSGADLSADFTTDIAGNTRTVPWTIGAYIVAGGPPPVGVENMRVKVGGVWVNATPSIKVGSQWVSVDAYVKVGAAWVPVYEQ